ncbi:hypothetical protein BDK51DRAFT_37529 [Blyttiomyces helicus]|uniref:Inhibitor I9 domain-containing protein n=1 Tax=Blyttiomyces helicus TaxID=388810 RepID=A0A4P9WEQ8_9FUNG|nr:hypothetical protein BDK51DRAFT_37529 [Blyttiomyces helicus]|eukprot:RKO91209.1 hypothetical protein BDK51DRAFT_37529 [Blyttiomyces helicus]
MRLPPLLSLLLALAFAMFAAPAAASKEILLSPQAFAKYIVVLKDKSVAQMGEVEKKIVELGGKVVKKFDILPGLVMVCSHQNPIPRTRSHHTGNSIPELPIAHIAAVSTLSALPEVDYVEADAPVHTLSDQ